MHTIRSLRIRGIWRGLLLLPILLGYNLRAQGYSPDFSLSLEAFEAQALKAKQEVWVVDFWASWCGPCIVSVPHMKEVQAKYAAKGVKFISISWDQEEENWLRALERLQMPWAHIRVPKGEEMWLERAFPHSGIPTAFVIATSGKPKKVSNVYALEKAIQKALSK